MRAHSFVTWLERSSILHQEIEIIRYQGLEETSRLYNFGVNIYNWIQKTWPVLHHIYFNYLEIFSVSRSKRLFIGRKKLELALKKGRPDIIISVHGHLNHVFREIAQQCIPSVKFVTYCGEMYGGYGFSRHWVDSGADLFIGATTEICHAARMKSMPKDKIFNGGFMLNPNFYNPPLDTPSKTSYLQKLGLNPNKFTLLLSTGANGAQNHYPLLEAIAKAELKIQIIALCSKDIETKENLKERIKKFPKLEVKLLSYIENMSPLMQSVDCILARPGTGTTSEAIMSSCPILFNTIGGIMPQEWITVKYCRAHNLGTALIKKPEDLVEAISTLFINPLEQINSQKETMETLRPQKTPDDILKKVLGLCEPKDYEKSSEE